MERTIVAFETIVDFENWLKINHTQNFGVWIKIAKKESGKNSITYAEALDCALCFGWIDGQKSKLDDKYWLQYFTKRKKNSIWSQINREKIGRLIESGKMQKPGEIAIEDAKNSGQWDSAYQSMKNRSIPEDFEKALNGNKKAKDFFESLGSQNRFAFVFRISTAKKHETRQNRINESISMLEKGEVFYPKKDKQ
jgi:uncharacterized protein YdeI (YjbR/CyaY-like superfamily)